MVAGAMFTILDLRAFVLHFDKNKNYTDKVSLSLGKYTSIGNQKRCDFRGDKSRKRIFKSL